MKQRLFWEELANLARRVGVVAPEAVLNSNNLDQFIAQMSWRELESWRDYLQTEFSYVDQRQGSHRATNLLGWLKTRLQEDWAAKIYANAEKILLTYDLGLRWQNQIRIMTTDHPNRSEILNRFEEMQQRDLESSAAVNFRDIVY